jgi:GT2 family glycosyltransferase
MIFDSFIPKAHRDIFVNQDLDPYLQRLYLKFGAAPMLTDLSISNLFGGSNTKAARYPRVHASKWRERVLEENICIAPIQSYLGQFSSDSEKYSLLLIDIVVPSYRINKDSLTNICSIDVPNYIRTTFILIVDNPSLLVKMFDPTENISHGDASLLLEEQILDSSKTKNNVRVRCNERNLGASASRNRGIEESAAEYIIFLDDDVIPEQNLLDEYGKSIKKNINSEKPFLGLVGLVHFPRDQNMSIFHAGVFMSYLLFSFEIATSNLYLEPGWGVTANILFRKFPRMSFDTTYAKTGGGEDIDFALRLSEENGSLKLKCCPSAKVTHLIWDGGFFHLCKHFFRWANGDSGLFNRSHRISSSSSSSSLVYISFPNIVETWAFVYIPYVLCISEKYDIISIATTSIFMFLCDLLVDLFWKNGQEFQHRLSLVLGEAFDKSAAVSTARNIRWFGIRAHIIANFYIIALECGRLYGHLNRGCFQNICHRFDWHCGRLEDSKKNFVSREMIKFIFFASVIKYVG